LKERDGAVGVSEKGKGGGGPTGAQKLNTKKNTGRNPSTKSKGEPKNWKTGRMGKENAG